MAEVNLLARYPRAKRNVKARLGNKEENRVIAMKFGKEYFDGTREQGYGGYRYDGRWIPIAEDIVQHFNLKSGDRVLDVGCGKGFLVKDLMKVCPGLEVFGLDISEYAVINCEPDVIGRVHIGNATCLPFPDNSFQAVLSINTIHNLNRVGCIQALQEMERIAPGKGYVQMDAYRNPAEEQVLTLSRIDDPVIAVLGLAYKQDTHSTKSSPSLALLEHLKPFRVRVFDPVVPASAAPNPRCYAAKSELDACEGADALAVMTPWQQFSKLNPAEIAQRLRGRVVLDPYATLNAVACRAAGLGYLTLGVHS